MKKSRATVWKLKMKPVLNIEHNEVSNLLDVWQGVDTDMWPPTTPEWRKLVKQVKRSWALRTQTS